MSLSRLRTRLHTLLGVAKSRKPVRFSVCSREDWTLDFVSNSHKQRQQNKIDWKSTVSTRKNFPNRKWFWKLSHLGLRHVTTSSNGFVQTAGWFRLPNTQTINRYHLFVIRVWGILLLWYHELNTWIKNVQGLPPIKAHLLSDYQSLCMKFGPVTLTKLYLVPILLFGL